MTERERLKIKREKEMRTEEISKMISEGGLGSDKYYDIEKNVDRDETEEKTEED